MRFTEGQWQDMCGLKLHRVHSMWRCEHDGKTIKVIVPCNEIKSVDDTTRGPVLHFNFYSPAKNMISVKAFHFSGLIEKGPNFSLNTQSSGASIDENEDEISMTSDKLKVVIAKKGLFKYVFYYDGKLMTKGGDRGCSYVTDVDYEAYRQRDYNGRPQQPHMQETYIREVLSLDTGEYIYGLGERFSPLIKNGQSVDIWNRDGGTNSDQTYKNIPFYLSNRGYGVLVNTPARVEFEVGSVNVHNVEFAVEGEELEYIVIGGGSPKAVLQNYTGLTGRPPLLPTWSFGLWLSTSWMPDSDEKITMEFVDGMLERDIPLSVFHFDARWMDDFNCCDFVWSKRFGNAKELLKKIHDKGVKVCVWINPYVSQESRLFEEGKMNGYFIKNKDGSVYQTDVWMSGIGIVDFTNPDASKWYTDRLGEIIDMGVDCIKTDFAERLPTEVVYFDNSDSKKMHNYYTFLYNKAIFEMLEKKHGKGEACVFSRSSTVGTQQFPVNWGGDNDATYVSMAETLRAGLSFAQSGFAFWAHDISGFEGTATPDLYKRWVAFGMLSSHSRLHGKDSYRVPWCFDEESCKVLGYFTKLKCSLMPYIYSHAINAHLTGEPLLRAMMLEFPNETACLTLDRQYMFGENLLVAPIFQDDSSVEFYVPDCGVWTNYLDGERFEGGRWYKRSYDYFNLPLLARPGSIIAKGKTDSTPAYDFSDGVVYQIFEPCDAKEAECRLYDTQGEVDAIAKLVRKGDELTFSVEGKSTQKDWSIELVGIADIKSVSGGACKKSQSSVIISPEKGSMKLTISI